MHDPHQRLSTEQLQEKPKNINILTVVETITQSSSRGKGQRSIRFNISSTLSWSTALPTASSRPTARMPSPSLHNKLHNNFVSQQDRAQHLIIKAKELENDFIRPGFFQLRATRCRWASHLRLQLDAHDLPPASLPWLLQHSVFAINRFLVRTNSQHPSQPTTDTTAQLRCSTSGHPQRTSKGHRHLVGTRTRNRSTSHRPSKSTL